MNKLNTFFSKPIAQLKYDASFLKSNSNFRTRLKSKGLFVLSYKEALITIVYMKTRLITVSSRLCYAQICNFCADM